jgi:hypothetical protein
VRAYLSSRPDFTFVGHVASTDTMLALCALRRPDVVLIDADPTVPLPSHNCGSRGYPALQVVVAYRNCNHRCWPVPSRPDSGAVTNGGFPG